MSTEMVPHSSNGSAIATTEAAANWKMLATLADTLSRSTIIPAPLRGKPGDVLVILMTGQELGLAPMQSLRSIYVVDGKPTLSADLAAALVLNSPVCDQFRMTEQTDKSCTYIAKRRNQEAVTVSYNWQDATAAGLTGKQNWKGHPKAMLRARCAMAAARAVFPDLVAGLYDPDELEPIKPASVTTLAPKTLEEVVTPPAPAEATTAKMMLADLSDIRTADELASWKALAKDDLAALKVMDPDGYKEVAAAGKKLAAAFKAAPEVVAVCDACKASDGHIPGCPEAA